MKYNCPSCSRALNMSGGIVLVGQLDDRRTVFVFDPEPGSYRMDVADEKPVEPGTQWEFSCPLCNENLTTEFNKRLARLQLVDGDEFRQIVFSKVANEKATFVLGGDEMESHGEHAKEYLE